MANYKKNKVKGYQAGGPVPAMQPLQMRNILGPATGASGSVNPGYMNEYLLSDAKRRLSNRLNAPDLLKRFYGFKNQEENWQDYDMETGRLRPEVFETLLEGRWKGINPSTAEMYRRKINYPNQMFIGEHTPESERDYFNKGGKVQGFQTGGRAGTAFGLQTAGLQTQRDLEEQAEEQADKQSKWRMWGNLLGIGAGIAGSMLLPGLGGMIAPKLGTFLAGTGTGTGFLGSALGKALGKGVASAVPKALTKYGVASAYNPKEYTSKTGFGLDKYRQLGDRGSAFRQRGREAAGVGMLTDIGTAIMPSPTGSGRVGTFSEQIGAGPVEWGGYTPTADWQNYLGSADFMQPGNIIPSAVDLSSSFQAPGRLPFRGGGRVSNYYGR